MGGIAESGGSAMMPLCYACVEYCFLLSGCIGMLFCVLWCVFSYLPMNYSGRLGGFKGARMLIYLVGYIFGLLAYAKRLFIGGILIFGLMIVIPAYSGEAASALRVAPGLQEVKLTLCDSERKFFLGRGGVVLGVLGGNEPVEVIADSGVEGIAIDYLSAIFNAVDVRVEVRYFLSEYEAIKELRGHRIDILVSRPSYGAIIGEFLLTKPFLERRDVSVIKEVSPVDEWDFRGVIAIVDGYWMSDRLREMFPAAKFKKYKSVREALESVEYGHSLVYVGDELSARYQMAMGELSSLKFGETLRSNMDGYGFLVRKEDDLLKDILDKGIAMVSQLSAPRILNRWGGRAAGKFSVNDVFTEAERDWLSEGPIVDVVVSGTAPPYSFYSEDGRFRGVAADLLERIASDTGMRFNFIRQPSIYSSLDLLKDGDADMAVMLSKSSEREGFLNFTRPFIENSFALVTPVRSEVSSVADIEGGSVAVLKSSIAEEYFKSVYPGVKIVSVDNHLDAMLSVAEGRSDVAVALLPVARYLIAQYFVEDLKIAGAVSGLTAKLPFAVRKDEKLLYSILDKYSESVGVGEIADIAARWNREDPAEESVWRRYVNYWWWLVGFVFFVSGCVVIFVVSFYLRRTKRQAEAQALQFRGTLIDGIPQAIVVRDLAGRIVLCNMRVCELFSLNLSEVIGRLISDFPGIDQEQAAWFERDYFEILQRNQPDLRQVKVVVFGKELFLRQWAVPYHGVDGCTAGLIMGWIDLTENAVLLRQLSEARDVAVQASKAKSRFLAVMSHEIRTPLNAIIGMLELALRKIDRGEALDSESIAVAHGSSLSLLQLVGDVLDLSKIESDKLNLELKSCNPEFVLDSSVRVFEGMARQKGIYLVVEKLSVLPESVFLDEGRLRQVVSNLLSNAIKFTDSGGVRVKFGCYRVSDVIRFEFEFIDSGIGIALEDQSRLFQSFVQVGDENLRGGTGLGLVICRELIQRMGGEIFLDSAQGEGTCVRFFLDAPVVDVTINSELAPALGGCVERPLRILLVDDHSANRLLLRQQLVFLGHEVSEACDGSQAFEMYQPGIFDVLITDCNMPVMDGYELTLKIRQVESSAGCVPLLRIVGFTANALAEEKQHCLDVGMDDCLFKPAGLDALRSVLSFSVERPNIRLSDEVVVNEPLSIVDGVFDVSFIESLVCGDRSLLRHLFAEFCTDNALVQSQLEQASLSGGLRSQGQLVHRIKGAAKMIGADLLVTCAQSYEEGLRNVVDDVELHKRASALISSMSQLQSVLDKYLSEDF